MGGPTVYLTVCDMISPWYLAEAVVQKPHRNALFYELQMVADGFRGRVSQVRILPGPLLLSILTHAALRGGEPSHYPLIPSPLPCGPPDTSERFGSSFASLFGGVSDQETR
jgi:hypothetical protein